MCKLTTLMVGKSLNIRKHLYDNFYSATYEEVCQTSAGLTNTLVVEKTKIRGKTHYLFVRWYSGEDTLKEMGYV